MNGHRPTVETPGPGRGLHRRWRRVLAGLLLAVLSAPGFAWDAPLVATRLPATATEGARERFEGAELVRVEAGGLVTELTAGFHSACDPDVSHDGRRVLFAGRRTPRDAWQVWELTLDGGAMRRITNGELDSRSPRHLSRLFTLDSPEPWSTLMYVGTEAVWNEAGLAPVRSLFNVKLDGGELRRVTANPADNLDPFQAWDGRVLYSSGRVGPDGVRSMRLFAVNIDGTDYELYGAGQGRRFQRMPCMTDDGWVVFVESEEWRPDGAGQLAAVREERPHLSYRPLTTSTETLYAHPAPWTAGNVVVSRREAGRPTWELVRVEVATGRETVLLTGPTHHWLQARVIRERARPDGRSTVVDTQYDTGVLYGLNVYDADARLAPHLEPGQVRRLRVVEGVPASAPGVPLTRRLLGEVPVEVDGSFNIEVPADIPIELQALDADGLALATCGWIWVKQKENRGCIGCHEDPERTPENLFVLAVQRPSVRLTLPPERRRSVGFIEDVLPVLEQRCGTTECHGGLEAGWRLPGGADARALFEALGSGYATAGAARTSRLIWHLLGRETTRPWDSLAGELNGSIARMPPPEATPLTAIELQRMIEWVDLGLPWSRTSTQPGSVP